jgi:hypothetical protein
MMDNAAVSSGEDLTGAGRSYAPMLEAVREHFNYVVGEGRPVFQTDAHRGLFPAFINNLPADERQHHTCNACRRFVDKYGSLVVINEDGSKESVFWSANPGGIYGESFKVMRRIVVIARITGVFLSPETVWGLPNNRDRTAGCRWHHLSVKPPAAMVWKQRGLSNADQVMAEKREDYRMLQRGLAEFTVEAVAQALRVLRSDALYRSDKCLGVAEWLSKLHSDRGNAVRDRTARDNVTWLAVATAPPGFCHVRSTMIGTLLADIIEGRHVTEIQRRFQEKMNPLQYQRPQAPPSTGNIKQAEKLMEHYHAAGALERRFARLEDIRPFWTPTVVAKPKGAGDGVFGHLVPKGRGAPVRPLDLPEQTMTLARFLKDVLTPDVARMDYYVPGSGSVYLALVTAANPDSPPILQWDSKEDRNQVSWYVYPNGSRPQTWNLSPGQWARVNAATFLPFMWDRTGNRRQDGKYSNHTPGVVLVLNDCRDLDHKAGAALFPEILSSEFHGVRRTIEAYSGSAAVQGQLQATACGLDLRHRDGMGANQNWNCRLRVTDRGGQVASYKLDRWE